MTSPRWPSLAGRGRSLCVRHSEFAPYGNATVDDHASPRWEKLWTFTVKSGGKLPELPDPEPHVGCAGRVRLPNEIVPTERVHTSATPRFRDPRLAGLT